MQKAFEEMKALMAAEVLCAYPDHMNILHVGNLSERRLCWISYVDEYGPNIHYIKGPCNVIVDTFSRFFAQRCALNLSGEESRSLC
jgi:hypothetical protein